MHIIQPSVYRAISLASHADRQNLNVGHDPDCHWIPPVWCLWQPTSL